MSKLFDGDSDSDFDVKTNNEYAKNYDNWRKKEELNKLKTKYGDEDLNLDEEASSSSSEDDEDGVELTEDVERDFFKTLSCLKNKDPRIYDENVRFFNEKQESVVEKKKKKKDQPMFIKDYERKLILEKGGKLSDSEDDDEDDPRSKSPTYVEEQRKIKENLKKALSTVDDEDEGNNWGGMFKERSKTTEDKVKEEADFKEWLVGQKKQLDDKDMENDLKPLKDYWDNPNLDDGEKFLKDYILNKRFLDKDDDNYIPSYEEVIHDSDESLADDADNIEKQEEFEHKYNFRFEEPDQDFIKRYPRTMEQSLRKKDDKRKVKRAELKERKQKEKEEKMSDIKKLKELKRKEIEEKIEKLKEVTGKNDVEFHDDDIDGDFDPEAHDKRMQALFNDDFYEGPEEEQKPEFHDLDEELEIENWERFEGDDGASAPHCEDDNFNMDCDYDPSTKNLDPIDATKGKKKRKRKSKFAELISQPKPKFDPNNKCYEKYMDEYYKLDCEDFIGELPCRFKYRQVVPNDFGLSVEEILMAKDRELNRWCSLKKAIQIRPDHVEKYDQIAYKKKAQNVDLKKKLLPSLFEEVNTQIPLENVDQEQQTIIKREKSGGQVTKEVEVEGGQKTKNKKKKKNKKSVANMKPAKEEEKVMVTTLAPTEKTKKTTTTTRKRKHTEETENKVKKQKVRKFNSKKNVDIGISDARLQAYGIKPKKFKNKLKYGNK